MKAILTAVNARYIHSNLAVYSLRAFARDTGADVAVREYTINQRTDEILRDLYLQRGDMYFFSCYIWNITQILSVARELKKVLPGAAVWLGGPEVSYDAERLLEAHAFLDGIMVGEGEETFAELMAGTPLNEVRGIVYRDGARITVTPPRELLDMDRLPFVYDDLAPFENKILYYETSRGCPFRCSYCLSSVDKNVRFRSFSLVRDELQYFLDHHVKQVKFVDRTFNCNRRHANEIWRYLAEHDNGVTNFHFELSADLLGEEEFALFSTMRSGLIQLEIGVQSTCPETLGAIRRTTDLARLKEMTARIHALGNIHQHLDLIAGLPYEDLWTFRQSFADVHAMEPDQLQLGFLKVLKGSSLYEHRREYGIVYESCPPYEVLATDWLTFDDVIELKRIEEMVEVYYNSNQYRTTLPYLLSFYDNPYDFYRELAEYYQERQWDGKNHSRMARYENLRQFALERIPCVDRDRLEDRLLYDLYLREDIRKRPEWAADEGNSRKEYHAYLKSRGLLGKAHMERFGGTVVLFDYSERNPLTYGARTETIQELERLFDEKGADHVSKKE